MAVYFEKLEILRGSLYMCHISTINKKRFMGCVEKSIYDLK